MPPVFGRRLYLGAALLLAISFIGLHQATGTVSHFAVDLGSGVPALVYEPGPQREFGPPPELEEKLPVVLLAHGFSGNSGMMSQHARRLARAGYAVVTFDFQGHGANANPFSFSPAGARSGLSADIDAALLYATTQPHYDPQRIAIAGHSMGGFAVMEYASRNAGVSAVIGIAGGGVPTGPYTPANALLIFASGDPEGLRTAAREAGARFADLDRVVLERTYGDPRRGTAVRVSEVGGVDHLTILYSDEASRRIVEWLRTTVGAGAEPAQGGEWRSVWSGLAFVAFLVLFLALIDALAPFVPRVTLPEVARPWRALAEFTAAQVGAVLLLAGVDSWGTAGPFSFVPLVVGRDLAGFYAVTGLLLILPLARRGLLRSDGLLRPRTWACAAGLLAFAYVVFGVISQPFAGIWLAPHRILPALVCFGLSLPLFAGMEWLLRGPGRAGVWAPALAKLLLLLTVTVAVMAGLLPFVLLLGLGAFLLLFVLFELFCWRLSRVAPNPWLAALLQAGWTGWLLVAFFPSES